MSNFDLGPVRGLRPDERDDAPVVSLGEMWGKTWEDTRKAQNFDAHLVNYSNAFDGIADRVKAATGEALDNPFRSASARQSVEMLGTFSREAVEGSSLYAQWRQRVQELKAKHADKLDWDNLADEPGRVAWDSMKKAREEADALSERIGMVAPRDVPLVGGVPVLNAIGALGANLVRHPQYTATQLAAGFAGQMTSPADAAVNLLSFGAGGAAKSIIKNATRNALANAAGQALLSAPKQLSYQSAGLPYGAQVWADEVGAAAGAGFVLDAGIRTPARAAIRRFGMDTPAGTTLSRNTERGGILFDAIEDATPKPTARLEIDPETIRKAEAGDVTASREILEKTGAMEDPAVKYAVDHMEAGGRLTDDVLNLLERELGVARPDGMKALAAAMQGRYLDALPEPVRQAPAPLLHERGAAVLDRVEAVSGAVERLPRQVRQMVQDGLDAGIPRIVQAVEQAIEGTPEGVAGRIMERVVPLLDERTIAEARLHSGKASPVELAQAIRQFPDLIDSSVDLEARNVAMARSIAGMDDAAYADVARGTIPPEIAALVADRVPKESQARVLGDLQRAEPGTLAEAADLIEAIAPPNRVPGTEGQLAAGSKIDDPAGAAAKAQTETLRQEAGQAYVDAIEPMQRRAALEDEIKTLRGQLIKGKREQSAEAGDGEASGPGAIRKQIEDLEREHALLQAKIMPGPEGYELARLATRAIDLRREADITAAVNDALRFGEQITPEGTRIEVRPDETMVSRAANGTVAQLDATSDMATGHIQLAISAMDPAAKIGHEAVHTLVTLGHLSPTEVDALAALAREAGTFTKEAEYRKVYDGRDGLERIISEEAAASYIEARIKGDVKGPANTVIERIRQLIERIRSALARQGFQSREDVVQAIMSGEAARREARADWRRDAVIQGKTEMRAAAERGTTLPDGTEIKGVPLFAIRAFHGSPHDFNRFSMDRIGTGEGAQAYGHGLYFAENERVALNYRNELTTSENPHSLDGKPIEWSALPRAQQILIEFAEAHSGDLSRAATALRAAAENASNATSRQAFADALQLIDVWRDRYKYREPGHLYEVRIDAEPEDFLDWDAPLSEQSDKIRKSLQAAGLEPWQATHVTGQIYRSMPKDDALKIAGGGKRPAGPDPNARGHDVAEMFFRSSNGKSKPEVSAALREAGIPGIKYLDQGSRNAGDGSRNFVVFDDSLIEIMAKDGEPVAPQFVSRLAEALRSDAVGGDAKTLPPAEVDLGFAADVGPRAQVAEVRARQEAIIASFTPDARRFIESHPPRVLAATIDMLRESGSAAERAAIAEITPRMADVRKYIAASRESDQALASAGKSERAARLAKAAAEPRPIDQAANVYHGTTETFDQYSGDAARARSAAAQDAGIDVVWVTPQKAFAERFGAPRSLTLEPGFYFDPMADTDLARLAPFINAQPNAARLWDQLEGTGGKSTWGFLENADTLKELQRLGYDGVKMQEQWMDAGERAKTAPTIAVFSRGKLFDTDRANMMFALRDWLPSSRQRRPLGAYRDADVITSDELPGRFTWKTPPKQGKVQMFHATNRAFDRFDPSKSQDFGIHFGTQKQAWTRMLNTDRIEGSRVIPANVEFSNAITLTDPGFWGPMEMMRLLRDKGVKFSKDEEDYFLQLAADIDRAAEIGPVAKGALRWIVNEAKDAIRDKLDEAGIDAIWYRNMAEGTGWSLAVWNEGQVRNTITGDLLYAMADAPPIKSDMAFVDRMNRMGELIAVCRG